MTNLFPKRNNEKGNALTQTVISYATLASLAFGALYAYNHSPEFHDFVNSKIGGGAKKIAGLVVDEIGQAFGDKININTPNPSKHPFTEVKVGTDVPALTEVFVTTEFKIGSYRVLTRPDIDVHFKGDVIDGAIKGVAVTETDVTIPANTDIFKITDIQAGRISVTVDLGKSDQFKFTPRIVTSDPRCASLRNTLNFMQRDREGYKKLLEDGKIDKKTHDAKVQEISTNPVYLQSANAALTGNWYQGDVPLKKEIDVQKAFDDCIEKLQTKYDIKGQSIVDRIKLNDNSDPTSMAASAFNVVAEEASTGCRSAGLEELIRRRQQDSTSIVESLLGNLKPEAKQKFGIDALNITFINSIDPNKIGGTGIYDLEDKIRLALQNMLPTDPNTYVTVSIIDPKTNLPADPDRTCDVALYE